MFGFWFCICLWVCSLTLWFDSVLLGSLLGCVYLGWCFLVAVFGCLLFVVFGYCLFVVRFMV